MEPKRNNSELNEESTMGRGTDTSRINDEDNLDTREISNSVEEGDEDYDDEELSEADFDVDEEESEGEDEEA